MELKVAGLQRVVGCYGQLQHGQSVLLIKEFKIPLQRVLWAHHHPHLIDQPLVTDVGGKSSVPEVDRVKRTSEDSDALHVELKIER